MPPVKDHVKSSFRRTGKEYRELHEWMDSEYQKNNVPPHLKRCGL